MFPLRPRIAFKLLSPSSSFNYHHLLFPFSSSAFFFLSVSLHISKLDFFGGDLCRGVCFCSLISRKAEGDPFTCGPSLSVSTFRKSTRTHTCLPLLISHWSLCGIIHYVWEIHPETDNLRLPMKIFLPRDNIYGKHVLRDNCLIASGTVETVSPCCSWQSGQLRWL